MRGPDEVAYSAALSGTARSVVLLAGLGAAALVALAGPAAYLVGTERAAPGIAGFAPGLFGYALFALLSRALYARGATAAAAAGTAIGWGVAAAAALVLGAGVFTLGLANAIGMSVIGVLLVLAVRRHAGSQALAGLGRATAAGIVAAVVAASAGWATVTGVARLLDDTQGVARSLVQGILGGIVVLAAYAVLAYALDRRGVGPLVRRFRRRNAEEGGT